MLSKTEIIISSSALFLETLRSNLAFEASVNSIYVEDKQQLKNILESVDKIDLLVLDSRLRGNDIEGCGNDIEGCGNNIEGCRNDIEGQRELLSSQRRLVSSKTKSAAELYTTLKKSKLYIKTIINLTDKILREDEIILNKPFKLLDLLNIIYNTRKSPHIFCKINNNLVYDEQLASLTNNDIKIKLTEKENQVFKYLLLASNHQVNKNELLENVWQYNPANDSSTIETNLYRLKQKLPENLMEIKDNYYKLIISDIS